jgi:phage terminase large subunit-like protein
MVTSTAESGHLYVRRSIVQILLHDDKQGIVRFPDGANNDVNDTLVQAINRLKRKLKYLIDNEDDDMQSVTSPG